MQKDLWMPDASLDLLVAGVDEAGRGPLAGPVFAAAVILDPRKPILGLADSKKLTEKKREQLFLQIRRDALAWSVARSSVDEIDNINILRATLLGMQRAIALLKIKPMKVLVDGNQSPELPYETEAIVCGDDIEPAISAASIVAKVLRDKMMHVLDKKYPAYGFAKHKGYGTTEHFHALSMLGPCKIHRKSFAPIAKLINR